MVAFPLEVTPPKRLYGSVATNQARGSGKPAFPADKLTDARPAHQTRFCPHACLEIVQTKTVGSRTIRLTADPLVVVSVATRGHPPKRLQGSVTTNQARGSGKPAFPADKLIHTAAAYQMTRRQQHCLEKRTDRNDVDLRTVWRPIEIRPIPNGRRFANPDSGVLVPGRMYHTGAQQSDQRQDTQRPRFLDKHIHKLKPLAVKQPQVA
jgi:hypothetical protein